MKNSLIILVVSGLLAFKASADLSTLNGYSVANTYSLGNASNITVSNGVAYFFQTTGGGSADTQLVSYNLTSGNTTMLYDYGSSVYGSFVTVSGGSVYFADGTFNAIRSVNLGTMASSLITSFTGAYDFQVSGSTAYLSANPTFADNLIYQLNLSTGAATTLVDTGDGASGPIALDASGNLIYGTSGYLSNGHVYRFTSSQLGGAFSSHTALSLAGGTDLYALSGSSSFALGTGNALYMAFSPFGATSTAYLLSTNGGTNQPIATIATNGDYFTGASYSGSTLYLATTNGNATTLFAVVPEPASGLLGLLGGAIILLRRRI